MAISPNDPARIAAITNAIKAAVSPITGVDLDKADAAGVKKAADEAAVNTREAIFVTVAKLAHDGSWTNREIGEAAKAALKGTGANSDKAMSTFLSECRNAMDEKVRVYLPMFVDVRNAALEHEAMEKAADKDARLPIKLAFQRQYHTLMAMFVAAKDDIIIRSVEDLTDYAEHVLTERAGNAGKAYEAKEKLVAAIRELFTRFPDDDFTVAAETLEGITKTHMEKARADMLEAAATRENERLDAVPLAPVPTVVAERVKAATTVVDESVGVLPTDAGVAEGAIDILAGILEGKPSQLLAA